MSEIITYDDETNIINICKRIRTLAKLDRMTLDIAKPQDAGNTRLFKYLDYCGVDRVTFVKNYLSNLQPYMLSGNTEKAKTDNPICVSDHIYKISLYIKLNLLPENEMVISFHEDHNRGDTVDNSRIIRWQQNKVRIIADSITGRITDTNTIAFDVLIPRGANNLPVSLVGELQNDGTLLVSKNAVDDAVLNVCNQYIQDLYAGELDFPALNNVEIFSALQQIPFTSYGNTVFSNISVLVDNMSAQNSLLHRRSASFALETYISHLLLTDEQKNELIEMIQDKYSPCGREDFSIVTDMIIEIIKNIDAETLIIEPVT